MVKAVSESVYFQRLAAFFKAKRLLISVRVLCYAYARKVVNGKEIYTPALCA